MASRKYETGLVLVLALMLCRGAMAQSSCSNTLVGLSSCMKYVTGNSSTPPSSCCVSLDRVVQSQPQCLCPLLSRGVGFSLGIAINQTLALALPAACNVQTPPVSHCDEVASGPAGVHVPPVLSSPPYASNGPPKSPAMTTTPSIPSGSKTVPETTEITSDGSTVASPIYLRFVTLFIAARITNIFHF